MPYHLMSRHVMSCHVMSCHVTPRRATSLYVTSRHAKTCHDMLFRVTPRFAMSCHVTSCYAMVYSPDGLVQMGVTIPDTITTWVMQAVAINNRTGLGLATPLRILAWRPIFLSLKFPYSVKRGEQISILATVFNYHDQELRVSWKLRVVFWRSCCRMKIKSSVHSKKTNYVSEWC